MSAYIVEVPPQCTPGSQFTADLGGRLFKVTVPPDGKPLDRIRVEVPLVESDPDSPSDGDETDSFDSDSDTPAERYVALPAASAPRGTPERYVAQQPPAQPPPAQPTRYQYAQPDSRPNPGSIDCHSCSGCPGCVGCRNCIDCKGKPPHTQSRHTPRILDLPSTSLVRMHGMRRLRGLQGLCRRPELPQQQGLLR